MVNTLIIAAVTLASGLLWWIRRRRPGLSPWAASLGAVFPFLLAFFLLRCFVAEPYRIPSRSMQPTLAPGDMILVGKSSYGVKLPIAGTSLVDLPGPARGDVIVFRYPDNPEVDYIKRVVGLPGGEVSYLDKKLVINGEKARQSALPAGDDGVEVREERFGNAVHRIGVRAGKSPALSRPPARGCRVNTRGIVCEVPQGHYFVMGDNRDNSKDSRHWGFVPRENIIGRAFCIWANFEDMSRVGRIE